MEFEKYYKEMLRVCDGDKRLAISQPPDRHAHYQNILQPTRILIIDDGSTDETPEIVSSFNDSRIKYFLRKHYGFSNAANFGLNLAINEYVARMDADDLALPERLQVQVDFLNKYPEYDVVSCWYAMFSKQNISYVVKTPIRHNQIVDRLALHSDICHPGVIFPKSKILPLTLSSDRA